MTLTHYTDLKLMKILATMTRRTDISVYDLDQSHIEIGRFLAYQVVDSLELEEVDIQHVLGLRKGVQIKNEREILFVVFLRSGLYIAEGFRTLFRNAPFAIVDPKRYHGLNEKDLAHVQEFPGKTVIILDAVINTGNTLFPVLKQLGERERIIVCSLVTPRTTAEMLKENYPSIDFYLARLSYDQYVGKGKTDTGNRLFGTWRDDEENTD